MATNYTLQDAQKYPSSSKSSLQVQSQFSFKVCISSMQCTSLLLNSSGTLTQRLHLAPRKIFRSNLVGKNLDFGVCRYALTWMSQSKKDFKLNPNNSLPFPLFAYHCDSTRTCACALVCVHCFRNATSSDLEGKYFWEMYSIRLRSFTEYLPTSIIGAR